MIELTEDQVQAMDEESAPLRVLHPRTHEAFVLVPLVEYEKTRANYDDSPWTREEIEAMAWEHVNNDEWGEYDDPQEKP